MRQASLLVRKFESLREIEELPDYIPKVFRGTHQFREIVGWYQFKDKCACSIADCGTPHNRGYVVSVFTDTSKGSTKIGNICGRRVFGKSFRDAAVMFERGLERQRLRDTIEATLGRLPEIEERAQAMLDAPRGARWLYRATISLSRVCGSRTYQALMMRVLHREAEVTDVRERTEKDGSHTYTSKRLAFFQGLRGLGTPEPKELLEDRIVKPLRLFSKMTADEIVNKGETRRWFAKWERNLSGHFQTADQTLKQAELFFTTENLRQLHHLATQGADRERLQRVRWNERTGLVE